VQQYQALQMMPSTKLSTSIFSRSGLEPIPNSYLKVNLNHDLHLRSSRETKNLQMSSSTNEDKSISKLTLEYNVASKSFQILSLIMLVVHTLVGNTGSKATNLISSFYYISGPMVASGICSILVSALENNRLKSDTYQRLNLFLVLYSSIQLLAVVIDTPNLLKRWSFSAISAYLSVIPAWKGWTKGIQEASSEKVNQGGELWKAGLEIVSGMVKFQTIKGFIYLMSMYLLTFLKVQKLLELKQTILIGGNDMTYLIATRLFRYSKLSLLFGTLFTLKSAADRDRLGGTTFINLNYWCSFFFLSKTVFSFPPSLTSVDLWISLFFSTFCGYNGLSESMKKKKKA